MRAVRTIALAAMAALAIAACKGKGPSAANDADMSMGKADASVKIIEYASAACSHCAAFNNDVFPAFKAKYIDTGQVHYTLREFLAGDPSVAAASFLTARCAGKDKYFAVLDSVYRSEFFSPQGPASSPRDVLLGIARSTGMTEEQFDACINDDKALLALNERHDQAATKDGITGTPTFFVNGVRLDPQAAGGREGGEVTLAQLDAAVAAAKAGKDPQAAVLAVKQP